MARAAGRKRLVLELGGNAATIVCEDADIAGRRAGLRAHRVQQLRPELRLRPARLRASGTGSLSSLGALAAEVAKLRTGDPLDDATDVGSMVDEDAAERVVRWTAEAAASGAEVVLGGTRDGATMHPTVVANPPATASIVVGRCSARWWPSCRTGPSARSSRPATPAGTGCRRDCSPATSAASSPRGGSWQVGGLVVNGSSNFRLDHVPFGGVKDSGFGRESPRWMIDDYTVVKTLLLRGISVFGRGGNVTVSAAEALAAQLESYGVEYVFGTCGHTNIALLDAIGRSRIRFVIARHEQAAAHAADGYARASGKPGVLLVHVGPGMMNAVTGVATAAMDSVPLSRSAATCRATTRAGTRTRKSTCMPTPTRPPSTGRSPSAPGTCTAPRTCPASPSERSGPPPRAGPARSAQRADGRLLPSRPGRAGARYPLPADPDGQDSSRAWPPASRTTSSAPSARCIYIGGGLRTGQARKALLALAEHLDIPIAHSLMAKGTVPDSHPLVLGMPGFWGLEFTNSYARSADLVLALGTRFAETDASSWHPDYTWRFPPSRLIQVDIDPAEIGRNFPVEIGAVADTALAVTAIADAVTTARSEPVSRDGLRATIAAARGSAFAAARQQGQGTQFPLRPQRILADLRAALPPDAVLVTDVGWNKNGVAQCYELPAAGPLHHPGRGLHDGIRASRRRSGCRSAIRSEPWWRSSGTAA